MLCSGVNDRANLSRTEQSMEPFELGAQQLLDQAHALLKQT